MLTASKSTWCCCWFAGEAFHGLPVGAAPDVGLNYLPHNPALDAAMRELQSTMHRGTAWPAMVRSTCCGRASKYNSI